MQEFSNPEFTKALGQHGELMVDAALASGGFIPTQQNVRQYTDKEWTLSAHDLDRVYERDGIAYGAEIKNTLSYIPTDELRWKLAMCRHLALRPLFIVRGAPKNYINQVWREGGFTLVLKYQLYPFGKYALAKRVRERLRMPVDCPARLATGTVQRFLNWHLKTLRPPTTS